jgi:uncharacterized protein (DUF697 family)
MTRKQLPKAITRTGRDLKSAAALLVPDEEAPAAPVSPKSPQVEAADSVLTISAQPAANDPLPGWSERAKALAVQRRVLAVKIVERHKVYAAAGGLVPVPIANVAAVTAIIMRMVKQLSGLYQVPFEQDRTRSAIIGLMDGAVPTGLGTATASTLAIAVPGSAFVGLGVSAVTAGALTRGIGLVFIEHYETGAPLSGNMQPKHF